MCLAGRMDLLEGADADMKTEELEEAGEVKPPTLMQLWCLIVGIQTEMAAARQERQQTDERITARLEASERAARDAYNRISLLGVQMSSMQATGQSSDDEDSGQATPGGTNPPSPTPPTRRPPPPPATQPPATSAPRAPTPPTRRPPPPAAPATPPRRPKPQEFDGRVSLEAYLAQFEMLAQAQAWDEGEKAVQLAASLKGPAVEILGQLDAGQRSSYDALVSALERRYGHEHQSEAFRSRFRTRVRSKGESLQDLAQDLEHLVRKAYPHASEELTGVLLRDQFIDALLERELQLYVRQAHVNDLQKALARALEFESFMKATDSGPGRNTGTNLQARRVQNRSKSPRGRGEVKCWMCGELGHLRRDCPGAPRRPQSPPAGRRRQGSPRPCCWRCGEAGHLARSCPAAGAARGQGNDARLDRGANGQPGPRRPRSR